MNISQDGINLIKEFEGYAKKLPDGNCEAYSEVINGKHDKWTIGYGCTRGVTQGMVWTPQQAEDGLRTELAETEREVNNLVKVPISQHAYDALVSFHYNTGGLGHSTVLQRINAGNMEGAAKAFAAWNKFGGAPCRALIRRRAQEAALFLKPDPTAPAPMPQNVDIPDGLVGTAVKSKSVWMQMQALAALGISTMTDWGQKAFQTVSDLVGIVPEKKDEISQLADTGSQVAGYLSINAARVVVPLVAVTLIIAMVRHVSDKKEIP